MFYQEGQSMSNLLVSGIAHLDTNLGTVGRIAAGIVQTRTVTDNSLHPNHYLSQF